MRDIDIVPTLEEYDRFLSWPTIVNRVYRPPIRSLFRKWLAELLGLRMAIVDVLTWYCSRLGGSMPLDFLICRFGLDECSAAYGGDFMDL